MKRLTALALVIVSAMVLISGCGSAAPKEFSREGLTITLTENFSDETGAAGTEQYTAAFMSERDIIGVLVLKEDFSIFEDAGVPTDISLEEYAQYVIEANRVDSPILNVQGLTVFEYERISYTYFSVVYRGPDAYWIVQLYTASEKYEDLRDTLIAYALTVRV